MTLFAVYDPTINLGTILSAIGIIATIVLAAAKIIGKVNRDLATFQQNLLTHTKLLEDHAKRMDKQDGLILDAVKGVERLVGRLEGLAPFLQATSTAKRSEGS